MLNQVSSNRAYFVAVAASLVSAVLVVVTALTHAVDRTQAFI